LFLRVGEIFFKILDGHAAGGAAASDAGEVGGVQAQFVHARFHSRRHIAGPGGVRWHGQAANGGLNALSLTVGCGLIRSFVRRLDAVGRFRRG